ncbi:16S rRNA (uracil1498-N3)-methyltransferase [Marinitoga hydrogenitolerans DSM 16785]|uniref:Ribosomal RNA small subunit methyltransferase E n=1 Tax=Marinitoga hydrogenitolerans (strain DSM 16785 / JCM 12826 / AT1271) TaxID=1122195 RepID=A0A1M4W9S4_MARH1|nr:RsmE family RNA methyltransferase [Marinitoga hydrogenitolerans]SHE77986.1 16S rRNA (uracil1498-N3)-methyltransferase [Marinitoga hydrogenitolerans DSM 16785]
MPNAFYGTVKNETIILDKNETSHIKIVRFHENDEIKVYDGNGNIYYCKIDKIKKNETICQIVKKVCFEKIYKPQINFYIGASKFDRMKLLIEKLVELRVNNIYIFHGQKSQLKFKNLEKFKRTIIESSKQSEYPIFPKVELIKFEKLNSIKNPFILDLTAKSDINFALKQLNNPEIISIILGPDMGFSNDELSKLPSLYRINLGNSIMRFETAGIYILSILNYYFNRLY